MPTTANRQYPYPTLSSANDPPRDLQQLAEAVDADVHALMTAAPIAPVYEDGWGPYGGGTTFLGVTATRSAAGLVGLSGMVGRTGATIPATTAAQELLELPEGYRPSRQLLMFLTAYSGESGGYYTARVDIYPDGLVTAGWTAAHPWNGTGNVAFISLAGVSYVAAS